MPKKIQIVLATVGALLIATMQNCGAFHGGSMDASSSAPGAVEGPASSYALLCHNVPAPAASKPSLQDRIAAFGRLSPYGFLTKDGRLFYSSTFGQGGAPSLTDSPHLYAWMGWDAGRTCGVTTDARVRCQGSSDPTTWADLPQLAGSLQVSLGPAGQVCGLQTDQSLTCVDANGVTTSYVAPSPLILLAGNGDFYGSDKKLYTFQNNHLAEAAPAIVSINNNGTTTSAPVLSPVDPQTVVPSGFTIDSYCGQSIAAAADAHNPNYTESGCFITDAGQLFCTDTVLDNGNPQLVSFAADGSSSKEFTILEPTHQYTAVMHMIQGIGAACAVRLDQEIVCFSTGTMAPQPALKSALNLTATALPPFKISAPQTIVGAGSDQDKGCVVRSDGTATCWRLPTYETGGIYNAPYDLKPSQHLKKIIGVFSSGAFAQRYGRACFLSVDGELLCEPESFAQAQSGVLTHAGPDVRWKNLYFGNGNGWSSYCGVTTDNQLLCPNVGTDQELIQFTVKTSNIATYEWEYRSYIDQAGVATGANGSSAATGVIYSGDQPNLTGLFTATDGKTYIMSAGTPVQVSPSALASIQNLVELAPHYYYDPAAKACPYFSAVGGGFVTQPCLPQVLEGADPNDTYSFMDRLDWIWIRNDGTFYGQYGSRMSADRIAPTVLSL